MDMNYLYQRRGEERLRAGVAACEPSRAAHLDLADRYGGLIHDARAERNREHAPRLAPQQDD